MEWNVQGLKHYLLPQANIAQTLEPAIYILNFDKITNQLYLDRDKDSFNFDYKIYDLDKKFIDRVVKTYHNTKNNLGILLHGIKGTGKSVTAKMICNTLGLPVILVTTKYAGSTMFFNNIKQDVVIFIDEYEKIYEKQNTSNSDDLLSLMDGVLGNGRKVFLMTSNLNQVNENMMQRPSRILYKKEYGNLTLDSIIEVVDDILVHTHRREKVIEFISQLELITIDIIKSVVREVNIHDEDPEDFESFFNVRKVSITYSIYKIDVTGEEKLYRYDDKIYMPKNGYDVNSVGTNFYTRNNNIYEGKIIKINTPYDIIVDPNSSDDHWEDDGNTQVKKDNVRFLIKMSQGRHKSFETYYKK
jgi:hypothetical protein